MNNVDLVNVPNRDLIPPLALVVVKVFFILLAMVNREVRNEIIVLVVLLVLLRCVVVFARVDPERLARFLAVKVGFVVGCVENSLKIPLRASAEE